MLRKFAVLSLCLLLLLVPGLFSGCGSKTADLEAPPPAESGTGQPGEAAPPKDVPQVVVAGLGRDPGEMYGYGAHPPLTRVLETLIFQDGLKGLLPALATGWEISADNLTWTLFLREGVSFHDGTPFDAVAVVQNLERIAAMSPGRLGALERVEAAGTYEVRVTHKEPFASFLYALAWPGSAMISPAAVDETGKVLEPVGTGPFKRESWEPGEKMTLVRNDLYWGGVPRLERIELKFIPDPTTRMMALEAGEIDMIIDTGGVLPEQVATLKLHPQIEVLTVAGAVPHYLSLNTRKWPLDDVRVRRAIVRALDLESIVRYALEDYGKVMTSMVPYSEQEWLHPEVLFPFNRPREALALLQEAGWQRGADGILQKDGRKLELKFLLSTALVGRFPYQPIAEIVQAQLGELGINVEIEIQEAGLWRETLQKGEAHFSARPWSAICPQSRLHAWLHSAGEQNLAMGIFYHNPTMDRLTEQLLRTTNLEEAVKISYQIQELAAEEVPLIPLYDEVLINAVRKKIKGYKIDPKFNVNWEDIYVDG